MKRFKIYQIASQINIVEPSEGDPCVFMSRENIYELMMSVCDSYEIVMDDYSESYMRGFECEVKPNKRKWIFRVLCWTEQIISYQNQNRWRQRHLSSI